MKKTSLKDLPSVHQVLLEIKDDISLHNNYLKFIINKELDKIRGEIKEGEISKSPQELLVYIIDRVLMNLLPSW